LSQEEILADPITQMNLYHLYSDKAALQTTIPCYSIYELFAEKFRAFVERMRPRDLYDIVYLHDYFKDNHLQKEHLIHLLQIKFEHKSLKFPQHLQYADPIKYETVKSDWDDMLGHQISNLQPIETYLPSVAKLISWLIY
jgi:predicted nucleotidyltransferase component of viral defense system